METNNFETAKTGTREIDAGLRKHLNQIYAKMSGGVLVTALVALVVGTSPMLMNLFLGGPQKYVVMLAPLAIIYFGFRPEKMPASKLMIAFFALAVVYGISFSAIAAFGMNDPAFALDVARAFFIATIMFGGLSILGYTTKKDLSGMQTFLSMGIIGLVGVSLMNLFFQNSMLSNLISVASILLFSGLTVWQTQNMKRMYSPNMPAELANRMGWAAALNLYISFIAMFQSILQLMSQR